VDQGAAALAAAAAATVGFQLGGVGGVGVRDAGQISQRVTLANGDKQLIQGGKPAL